jgi:hypothetical protein
MADRRKIETMTIMIMISTVCLELRRVMGIKQRLYEP